MLDQLSEYHHKYIKFATTPQTNEQKEDKHVSENKEDEIPTATTNNNNNKNDSNNNNDKSEKDVDIQHVVENARTAYYNRW